MSSSSLTTLFNQRYLVLCAAALVTLPHFAEIVSPSSALNIARQYVQVKAQDKQRIKKLSIHYNRKSRSLKNTPYYLFNDAKGQGFVLVAADNAMGEVLAYSDRPPTRYYSTQSRCTLSSRSLPTNVYCLAATRSKRAENERCLHSFE